MLGISGNTRSQFDVERDYSLSEPLWCLDFAAPRLFLVLPSNLDAWDDNDVTTHTFRLYFLCDFKYRKEYDHKSHSVLPQSKIRPEHIHLSGHQGYDLKRSNEFFDSFGHFALEILKIVKDGFLDEYCCVPSLHTFRILESCEGTTIQHHLTRDNIEQLVDMSITYIQQQQSAMEKPWGFVRNWLPQRYQQRLWMDGPETRQIRWFLHLPEDDGGVGNLLQTLYPYAQTPARWLCSGHAFEHSIVVAINELIQSEGGQFTLQETVNDTYHWRVDLQGGVTPPWTFRDSHIDLQQGTIAVCLGSLGHASAFAKNLKGTKRTFDLAIRMTWGPTRKEIQTVLNLFFECNVRFLEIDASNLDALHLNPMEYTRDFFVEHLEKAIWRPGLFVTLLDFPQPTQKYMYFGVMGPKVFGLILNNTPERPNIDWWEAQRQLFKFHRDIVRAPRSFQDVTAKLAKLSERLSSLIALGLQSVDMFDVMTGFWGGRFPVVDGVIGGAVEGTTPFKAIQLKEFSHPTLRRIIVQYNQPATMFYLCMTIRHNPGLQQIDVPAHEHDIYGVVEEAGRLWHWYGGPNSLEVTIYEQGLGRVGRTLATVEIHKAHSMDDMTFSIVRWDCSYVPRTLVNREAMILAALPRDHPAVLETFTLHVDRDAKILSALARDRPASLENFTLRASLLSEAGLASIPQVLRQANIRHLTIECTAFDASSEAHLGETLGAVQWSMIQSLTLFGDNINAWIQLWAQHSDLNELVRWDHQLLWLGVIGPEMPGHEFSHASAMWLHNVIYLLTPIEIHIESIHLVENDWRLVESAVDNHLSDGFVVVNCNNPQIA